MSETTSFPLKYQQIQYNHCKNPKCDNFGVEPVDVPKHSRSKERNYKLQGNSAAPLMICCKCGEMPPMKSNHGIYEEVMRLGSYLRLYKANERVTCPNEACSNHNHHQVTDKTAYSSFGTNKAGTPRVKCKACGKVFVVPQKGTRWQHSKLKARTNPHGRKQNQDYVNEEIFIHLMNKVPLNRIVAILGISWEVLYNRIDYIHKQCLKFSAYQDIKLSQLEIPKLYISVDRQEYQINWTDRIDKRNVTITSITSADNSTGFIFGVHPNFDMSVDKNAIYADALAIGDESLKEPFRKYARFWLESDHQKSVKLSRLNRKRITTTELTQTIKQTYDEALKREDIEQFDNKNDAEKLPEFGIQIHSEYTMIGHFYFLKGLLKNVSKWRFFLDQEAGIRSAVLSVFKEEVKDHTAEAFYVRIEKDLTVDEKRKFKADAKKKFDKIKQYNQLLSDNDVKLEMLKEEIQNVTSHGKWNDRWVRHPFPSMTEANKAMCWLTEHTEFHDNELVEEIDDSGNVRRVNKKVVSNHVAWLYNKASLHGVDSFFQKIRRRLSLLERPIRSSSNANRVWNGYSPYNPAMTVKILEIFRVVHNFIDLPSEGKLEDKKTPAMRIGLTTMPCKYKDILSFEDND